MAYSKRSIVFVPPTAKELLRIVASNALTNAPTQAATAVTLPSLRARAEMVIRQTDMLSLTNWQV